jgi:hypothetical protein
MNEVMKKVLGLLLICIWVGSIGMSQISYDYYDVGISIILFTLALYLLFNED